MKRVRVYKEIISDENLRLAIREVNAGHRRNGNHSLNKKVIEIENNMDEYVEKLRAFIQGLVDGDEHMHPPIKRRRWDRNADSGTAVRAYHQLWDTDSDTVTRSCESTIYSGSSNRFIFTTTGETGTESSRSRGLRG